jgi:hypothetical protein
VNPGTPPVVDSSNYFVGPYTLNVAGQNVAAMCMDDFYHTSGSWSANLTVVNSSNLANTYLGNNTYNVDGLQVSASKLYLEEAYLFSEIVKPGADRIDLQDAAWTIMDDATGHTDHSEGNKAVDNMIADAATHAGSFDASHYEIVSQVNPGSRPQQEFIVATPEPATCGLLGAAFLLLGRTRVWSRPKAAIAKS